MHANSGPCGFLPSRLGGLCCAPCYMSGFLAGATCVRVETSRDGLALLPLFCHRRGHLVLPAPPSSGRFPVSFPVMIRTSPFPLHRRTPWAELTFTGTSRRLLPPHLSAPPLLSQGWNSEPDPGLSLLWTLAYIIQPFWLQSPHRENEDFG